MPHVGGLDPVVATATTVDAVTFAVAATAAVLGSLGVVFSRNPVHSALMLVLTLFAVAVLFVAQDAQFLAAVQVIVYAGAIVVLFLFVIMLLGVDRRESLIHDPLRAQRPTAIVLGLATLAEVLLLARVQWATGARSLSGQARGHGSNVSTLAHSLFTTYLLPFEATAALLVIAVIGAVVLSRRARDEEEGGGEGAGSGDDQGDRGQVGITEESDVGSGPGRTGVGAASSSTSGGKGRDEP
jgi:NADH-quinone oxidoreductase subunit J